MDNKESVKWLEVIRNALQGIVDSKEQVHFSGLQKAMLEIVYPDGKYSIAPEIEALNIAIGNLAKE